MCVTLSVLQRRDLEISMTQGMKMDELRERCGDYGVKPKKRRKLDYVNALIYELSWDLRAFKTHKHLLRISYLSSFLKQSILNILQ